MYNERMDPQSNGIETQTLVGVNIIPIEVKRRMSLNSIFVTVVEWWIWIQCLFLSLTSILLV